MNENTKNISYGKVPREVTLKARDRLCSQIHLAAEECMCFSYFCFPMMKHYDQGSLQKEGLFGIWFQKDKSLWWGMW